MIQGGLRRLAGRFMYPWCSAGALRARSSANTVLFLLQLLLLVKFSLFCVVGVFVGGVMGCGEQVTNWHYFIQSSFALHSLRFELSHISLSVSLDSLLHHLFLRQRSITVHVRRSTHLLFMIFIVRKASPEGYLFQASGVSKGS